MEFAVEVRVGTEVSFSLPPTLSGVTYSSPSLLAPGDWGRERGGDAVEVKATKEATKEANTTRESMAEISFAIRCFDRRDGPRGTGDIGNSLGCVGMRLRKTHVRSSFETTWYLDRQCNQT